MFLYFSDWTNLQNLRMLDEKGLPHYDRLIKVFATQKDPAIELRRDIITVISDGSEFTKDLAIPGRGLYLAQEMEAFLNYMHITEEAKEKTRALFRFANTTEMAIVNLAMLVKNTITGDWHYHHPLRVIDGLEEAGTRGRENSLHLDIFTQRSIEKLSKVIDLENPEGLVTIRETVGLARIYPEGNPSTKEALN